MSMSKTILLLIVTATVCGYGGYMLGQASGDIHVAHGPKVHETISSSSSNDKQKDNCDCEKQNSVVKHVMQPCPPQSAPVVAAAATTASSSSSSSSSGDSDKLTSELTSKYILYDKDAKFPPDVNPTPEEMAEGPAPSSSDSNIHRFPDNFIHNFKPFPAPQGGKKQNMWLTTYIPSAVAFPSQNKNFMVQRSIQSKGQPIERRSIVRENFRKSFAYRSGNASLFFILSSQSEMLGDAKVKAMIDDEQRQFGDLLFVPCPDSDKDFNPPSATTIKMGYAFLHAATNYNFRWLARSSDDVHFNPDQLIRLTRSGLVPKDRVMMGKRFINNPVRNQYSNFKFGAHYPAYPAGLGYVISGDIALRLGQMVQLGAPMNTDWPEDAIIASWTIPFGIHIVDSLRWFHNKKGPGGPEYDCVEDSVMTHELSPKELKKVDERGVWRCR